MTSPTVRRLTTHLVLLVSLIVIAACTTASGSDGDQRRSGIRTVDNAIEAVLAGDAASLAAQAVFSEQPCTTSESHGVRPRCRDGETDGTVVQVVLAASCEGYYLRSDDLLPSMARFVEGNPELYAAYRHNGLLFPSSPYVIVFDSPFHPPASYGASQVFVSDQGITGVNFGCGQRARDLTESQSLGDPIIAPAS